jgi:hypothetical protein
MVRNHERHAVEAVNLTAQLADSFSRVQERLGRERPERNDHPWLDQLDLPQQEWSACLHLVRHWIAISGRAMLQDVADVDIAPRKFNRCENLVEELTSLTDEWSTEFVFSRSWCFSDAHEISVGIAFARHWVLRVAMKWTKGACRYSRSEFSQRGKWCALREQLLACTSDNNS